MKKAYNQSSQIIAKNHFRIFLCCKYNLRMPDLGIGLPANYKVD